MLKEIKKGFTLAEVLIVIGIIGVVAALTLPNLNHATGDKEKVTKVKKIYSTLTEAVDRAQAIYGPFDTWFTDLESEEDSRAKVSERFAKRVTEFMKISKDCGFNSGCFSASEQIGVDGEIFSENDLESLQESFWYMVMMPDGVSLAFGYSKQVTVDIDGPSKGKNQDGSDRFEFTMFENMLYPDLPCKVGLSCEEISGPFNDNYTTFVTLWVIENGNLDYLKCPDELNWETKTSCK